MTDVYVSCHFTKTGPLPNTLVDFWRMIWECETTVIVMACNESESGKYKCESYWPTSTGNSDKESGTDSSPEEEQDTEQQYGNITVKLVKWRPVCPDFLVRTLEVTNKSSEGVSETRTVIQFHYSTWPDHGVPPCVTPILELVRLMRDVQATETRPILVHCSAGCGRTGTICSIDYVWNLLRAGKVTKDFSLYNIILDMRKQRIAMVQTLEQYVLCYKAVAALFQQQLKIIDDHTYANLDEDGEPLILRSTAVNIKTPRDMLCIDNSPSSSSSSASITNDIISFPTNNPLINPDKVTDVSVDEVLVNSRCQTTVKTLVSFNWKPTLTDSDSKRTEDDESDDDTKDRTAKTRIKKIKNEKNKKNVNNLKLNLSPLSTLAQVNGKQTADVSSSNASTSVSHKKSLTSMTNNGKHGKGVLLKESHQKESKGSDDDRIKINSDQRPATPTASESRSQSTSSSQSSQADKQSPLLRKAPSLDSLLSPASPATQGLYTLPATSTFLSPLSLKMSNCINNHEVHSKLIGKATVIRRPSIAKLKAMFENMHTSNQHSNVNSDNDDLNNRTESHTRLQRSQSTRERGPSRITVASRNTASTTTTSVMDISQEAAAVANRAGFSQQSNQLSSSSSRSCSSMENLLRTSSLESVDRNVKERNKTRVKTLDQTANTSTKYHHQRSKSILKNESSEGQSPVVQSHSSCDTETPPMMGQTRKKVSTPAPPKPPRTYIYGPLGQIMNETERGRRIARIARSRTADFSQLKIREIQVDDQEIDDVERDEQTDDTEDEVFVDQQPLSRVQSRPLPNTHHMRGPSLPAQPIAFRHITAQSQPIYQQVPLHFHSQPQAQVMLKPEPIYQTLPVHQIQRQQQLQAFNQFQQQQQQLHQRQMMQQQFQLQQQRQRQEAIYGTIGFRREQPYHHLSVPSLFPGNSNALQPIQVQNFRPIEGAVVRNPSGQPIGHLTLVRQHQPQQQHPQQIYMGIQRLTPHPQGFIVNAPQQTSSQLPIQSTPEEEPLYDVVVPAKRPILSVDPTRKVTLQQRTLPVTYVRPQPNPKLTQAQASKNSQEGNNASPTTDSGSNNRSKSAQSKSSTPTESLKNGIINSSKNKSKEGKSLKKSLSLFFGSKTHSVKPVSQTVVVDPLSEGSTVSSSKSKKTGKSKKEKPSMSSLMSSVLSSSTTNLSSTGNNTRQSSQQQGKQLS